MKIRTSPWICEEQTVVHWWLLSVWYAENYGISLSTIIYVFNNLIFYVFTQKKRKKKLNFIYRGRGFVENQEVVPIGKWKGLGPWSQYIIQQVISHQLSWSQGSKFLEPPLGLEVPERIDAASIHAKLVWVCWSLNNCKQKIKKIIITVKC